ncbi:MAG: chemotaxis protein CheW [Fibrobacteria bacterium]|nr:chemotaxis protein CheW [Fibrobacteria bacterium]
MSVHGFDPQLYLDFLDEALESLEPLDRMVLALVERGVDFEILASVFRPVHSLKGNAGFFRLMQVKRLAHALENILDDLRQKRRSAVPGDFLLQGLDALRRGLRTARNTGPVEDDPEIEALVDRIHMLPKEDVSVAPPKSAPLSRLPPEIPLLLEILEPEFAKARPKGDAADLDRLVRDVSAKAVPGTAAHGALARCRESLDTILPVLGYDPVLRELLREALGSLGPESGWLEPSLPGAVPGNPPSFTTGSGESASSSVERTMRVPERSIDAFLGYVGELVVVEEVFQHLNHQVHDLDLDRMEEFVQRLRQNTDTFAALSRALRESILQLRRLPARQVLQKVPRLAHDVASRCGKQVKVEIVGEELQIDKSHLDLLDAPLTHLVNNAVDHGIEIPALRVQNGKGPEGRIRIELREHEDNLVLELGDDGGGLNLAALHRKAEEMGLVSAGQALDQNQIVSLLFQPGVSTSATISETSGRGVGMDVVRRQITDAGGRVEVETHAGRGTTFRIILPHAVRTQIIEGFVVRVGEGKFLFPLGLVGEVFPFERADFHEVPGVGPVVSHGEALLPLLALGDLLDRRESDVSRRGGTVVVLALDGGRAAVLIDEVLGIHKTVIKPLEGAGKVGSLYEGVGMMGDGSMSLILGASGLSDLMAKE